MNPVIWFEIYVQDMARARGFYEQVFGIEMQRLANTELEMWGFPSSITAPGASGTLVKVPGMPSGGNSTLVYFHCEDCATEAGRVATAGGHVFREKMSIGEYGFIALVTDTEGNLIGLHSLV